MSRSSIAARIVEAGAIAILRMKESAGLPRVAEALVQGGIRVLEVTLTTPGALEHLNALARRYAPGILIGVGSVVDQVSARRAVESGARFVVSPVLVPEVVEEAHSHGLPALPGVLTPSEAFQAHRLGADLVKVFPAGFFGKSYVRALLAPLPQLRLVPTGGVTPANAGDWLSAGASAVGVGSALLDAGALAQGHYHIVEARARQLTESISQARPAP